MTNLKPFNYVSLFSGIGGFEQALNKLGGSCVMASEIDKYANQAYEVLYGHSTVGDVTKVAAEDVPDHDLLVAGFPCPTFSVAGDRDGMEFRCADCGHEHLITYVDYKIGPKCPKCIIGHTEPKDIRGLLFFEIARIAEAKQPRALLMENVKGLVNSAKGETMRVIAETLNHIGYTFDFEVLNSKFFDVAQSRERVFITALRNDLVNAEEWSSIGKRSDVVAKGKKKISELGVKTFNFDWPEQKSTTARLRDILESDVGEKFYLSEEKTAKLVSQLETVGIDRANTNSPNMVGMVDLKGQENIRRVYDSESVGPTLTTMGGGHREPKIAEGGPKYRIRKLTPRECFRLQGFPDSEFDKLTANGISNSQLYKMAGNAVTVNVISALGKRLLPYINC